MTENQRCICRRCDSACHTCSGPGIHECTSCRNDWLVQPQTNQIGIDFGICQPTCNSKFASVTLQSEVKICQPCHGSCQSCNYPQSMHHCTACNILAAPYKCLQEQYEGTAIGKCSDRCDEYLYFAAYSQNSCVCERCAGKCKACVGPLESQCTACFNSEAI